MKNPSHILYENFQQIHFDREGEVLPEWDELGDEAKERWDLLAQRFMNALFSDRKPGV